MKRYSKRTSSSNPIGSKDFIAPAAIPIKVEASETRYAYEYTRISSFNQVGNNSLDAQDQAIEAFAKENNIKIVRKYTDVAKTGTTMENRKEFQKIILDVQNLIRDKFTFQFKFIGSSAKNMITFDSTTNIGFDFDINIEINDPNEDYSASEIRQILINALNQVILQRGFNYVENNTRVLTIKKIDLLRSKIQYSCDIAIVNNYIDKNGQPHQEYIRYNKSHNSYTWEEQPSPYNLEQKISKIKKYNRWNEVFELYIDKKNYNTNKNKKSRSLFAETIKEIYDRL